MRITIVAGWAALLLCGGCTGVSPSTDQARVTGARVGLLGQIQNCASASAKAIAEAPTVQFLSNYSEDDAADSRFPGNAVTEVIPANNAIRTALLHALNLADSHFLVRLCKDNQFLFVQTDAAARDFSGAYAFWQTKRKAGSQQPIRFISIPRGVFMRSTTYAMYEAGLVNTVIRKNADNPESAYQVRAARTSFDDLKKGPFPKPPSEDLALLAIIAHEEGHIIAERRLLRYSDNPTACDRAGGKDFTSYGWSDPGTLPPFHYFGAPVDAKHAYTDPFPATIANEESRAQGDKDMVTLYGTNHNFASLFAALAPDEDIAEAYRYRQLKHNTWSATTKQPLRIMLTLANGQQVDVIDNLAKGNNALKEGCIENNQDVDDPD